MSENVNRHEERIVTATDQRGTDPAEKDGVGTPVANPRRIRLQGSAAAA